MRTGNGDGRTRRGKERKKEPKERANKEERERKSASGSGGIDLTRLERNIYRDLSNEDHASDHLFRRRDPFCGPADDVSRFRRAPPLGRLPSGESL